MKKFKTIPTLGQELRVSAQIKAGYDTIYDCTLGLKYGREPLWNLFHHQEIQSYFIIWG